MRRARNTPPTPVVSPMVCRRPYRAGISRSRRVASIPPTCTMSTTKSVSASARRRSVVEVTDTFSAGAAESFGDLPGGAVGDPQPPLVDVEQDEVEVEVVEPDEVGDELPGEDDAAGPDEGHSCHGPMVSAALSRVQRSARSAQKF